MHGVIVFRHFKNVIGSLSVPPFQFHVASMRHSVSLLQPFKLKPREKLSDVTFKIYFLFCNWIHCSNELVFELQAAESGFNSSLHWFSRLRLIFLQVRVLCSHLANIRLRTALLQLLFSCITHFLSFCVTI